MEAQEYAVAEYCVVCPLYICLQEGACWRYIQNRISFRLLSNNKQNCILTGCVSSVLNVVSHTVGKA